MILDKNNTKCPKCGGSFIGDIGYDNYTCYNCENCWRQKSKTGLESNLNSE